MTAKRDLDHERQFLVTAAGECAFLDRVQERLAIGKELYGDSWAWIGVRRHLRELMEEAADIGAWATLCEQALAHDHALTDPQREHLRAVLIIAVRHGAAAYQILQLAGRGLDNTTPPA